MLKFTVTIINKLGLHTRAAAKLVATASQFESKIELMRGDTLIDAKSIMGVITLGAKQGAVLDVITCGADEQDARDALIKLIDTRFGEAE